MTDLCVLTDEELLAESFGGGESEFTEDECAAELLRRLSLAARITEAAEGFIEKTEREARDSLRLYGVPTHLSPFQVVRDLRAVLDERRKG